MRKLTTFAGLAVVAAVAIGSRLHAQSSPAAPDDVAAIAEDAYVYGYPLITMEMTRRVMTNVVRPSDSHAPMGQFANMRSYPDATFTDVTAPNADTLYSAAWLDLSKEPYILSVPDSEGRYYLMPMLDAWTNVFQVPGKRTTGTGPQTFAITGPGWQGTLPAGVTRYNSPTAMVWIIGRIYSTGTPEDYQKVHAFQDKLSLVPLSSWGKPYTPPEGTINGNVDMKTAVRTQVDRLDGTAYFRMLAELLRNNRPAAADAPMVAKLARLGIVPGQRFDATKLDQTTVQAIIAAPKAGQQKIQAQLATVGTHKNGWFTMLDTGVYGTHYVRRGFVAMFGLGANRPEDAVYPTSEADASGQPYLGSNKYVIHFAKGQTPPANAFWSLTMYNARMFFVANRLDKYTVSPRNALQYNRDGSLDIYVQKESPGKEREANWLPAPADRFNLMLRLYWPKPSVLDGHWNPPPVEKQTPSRATRATTPPL